MINGINAIDISIGNKVATQPMKIVGGEEKAFGDLLTEAIEKISALEKDSQTKQTAFAQGKDIEIHDVVIAMEKASIAMELALAVRNKVIEAYQEIMRMNV